jgi:Protein of unknown function, DUF481
MKRKYLLALAFAFLASPAGAREKSDIVVMKNGDRLTCEIKALQADVLYVSLDYALGTISLEWFKVDHLESNQLFLVKTQEGYVYSGTLNMLRAQGSRPVQIEVVDTEGRETELERDQVAKIDQGFQSIWQRFNGSVGLGAIYNKGNQSTQYNLATDVSYPRERWGADLSYDSNLSSNTGATTSSRNQTDISAYRLMHWNNWYYTGFAGFLQSTEQGIRLQSTGGGGVGRYIKNSNRVLLMVAAGLAVQRIDYQQKTFTAPAETVTSAWLSSQAKLFQFDRTSLTVTASFLPALTDLGRLHFNLNTSYYIKIWDKLNFNLSFYGNWDSRPPPGFSSSDYGTSAGVNWTFGSR